MHDRSSDQGPPAASVPSEHPPVMLETSPAIVWMWDPDHGCTYVSEAWTRILGRDVAEAIGEGWASSVHPQDVATWGSCRLAMRRNEPYGVEYRLRRADGTYAIVNDQGFPLREGSDPGPFIGAALEVTAQREADDVGRSRAERLDRVTQALSSSNTVEEVADAVFADALDALGASNGGLGLASPDGRSLAVTRLRGFDEKRQSWRSLPVDEERPITRAFRSGRSAFYRSTEEVVREFPHLRDQLLAFEARAALPLRVDEHALGVLYVAYEQERTFDTSTRAFFEAVADRIARALDRARLFDAARRSADRTRTLQRVTADLSGAVSVQDVERVGTRSARDAVAADACLLALVDADTRRIAFSETDAYPETLRDLLPTSLDPGSSPVADVVASGMSLSFDTSEELTQRYPELSDLVEELPFISRVFVPILGSGGPTGVLVASSRGVAHFDAEAVRLLEAIGRQCGQSLERATLYRDAHAATERAAALQAATLSIAEATTIEDVAAHAVSFAVELVDASIGALAMLDPDGTRLTVVHQVGATPRLLERWADVPATGLALAGEAAAAARSRWLTTDEVRETDPLAADDLEPLGIRSVVLIPLTSGGPILGYLGLARTDARPPPRERREILDTFADRVGGAIHRTRLFEAERRTRGELERALSRLSRLQAVSAAISQAVQVDEVAATALDASTDALGAAGGGVYIADGDVLRCIAARGIFTSAAAGKLDAIPTNAEMAMCAAYASGHVGWVPTYAEWSRRYPDGAALFEGVARSSIAIPFVVEDRILGVMTLVFSDEHVLDRAERRLARTIGHQAAVALERSMLHEREMARSRRTEYLQQLIAELAASSTATSVAATLTSTALDVLAAQAAAVALLEEDRVEVAAARGYPRAVVEAIAASEGGPGRSVIRTQHPAFLRTPEAIADRYPSLAEHLGPAMAELPLLVRGGVLGVLLLSFEQPRTFDLEQVDTLAAIASEAAQAIHRARVTQREREISRTLQSSLLPDEPISSWNGARVTTWYSAGTEYLDVGGDWYDAIELPDGRLAVSIGDVVGRGLRAAAAMGQLRSALRGLALELRGPGATLEALNRFAAMTPGTELATVAYGELDPISGSFTYACAGHPPPVAWIDGTVQVLEDGRSPLLAAGYDGHRGEATCSLPPGSTLVLYTDGLVERRDEPFHRGIARLQETLELAGQQELETLTETLIETLLADQDRSDDAALLCLRTGIPMSFSMTFPNEPEALRALRHQFQEWLEVGGSPVREAEALVLAVNEAAANAIEHGYREAQGNVEVTAEMRDHVVEVTVTDRGSWLDADPEPSRGRGLSLMRTLMDEVDLQAGPGGTRVVLRRQLAGDASPTPLATVGDER